MTKSRPALIVFCREPIAHQSKTRLIGAMTPASAAALSDAFIRDALAKAVSFRPSRIVIAASAPDGVASSKYFQRLARRFDADLIDQGSSTLGRRMARALEPFSSNGALLIGTDTPSLPAAMLLDSLEALRRDPVVIAPSLDGGYYAVGVRGPMPPIFTGIRWGSRSVFRFNNQAPQTRRHSIRARSRMVRRRSMARRSPACRPSATSCTHAPPHEMYRRVPRPSLSSSGLDSFATLAKVPR